jgi:hypothetical protein
MEVLRAEHGKGGDIGIPNVAFHMDGSILNADEVERVRLATSARASGGAGLNKDGGVSGDAVALGGVAVVAEMEVPSEKEIDAACGEGLHSHASAADQVAAVIVGWQIKGVMANYNFSDGVIDRA